MPRISPIWNRTVKTLPKKFRHFDRKINAASAETGRDGISENMQSTLDPCTIIAACLLAGKDDVYGDHRDTEIAIGHNRDYQFAEIQRGDFVLAAMYSNATGRVKAAKVQDGKYMKLSVVPNTAEDEANAWCWGEPALLAMLPGAVESNTEAYTLMETIKAAGWDDEEDGENIMNRTLGLFSDNIYRRVLNGSILLDIDDDGCLEPLTMLNSRAQSPDVVDRGRFQVFSGEGFAVSDSQFTLHPERVLTDEEKARVPDLPHHSVSALEYSIAELVAKLTGREGHGPVNLIFEGGVGSGKTEMAKHLAQMWGLPYATIVLSENSAEEQVTEHIVPKVGGNGGSTLKEKLARIIDAGDMMISMEPESVYSMLTGMENSDAEAGDIAVLAARLALEALEEGAGEGVSYELVQSEVIKALVNGWVLEIQEPTLMANPSVLGILNDAMNSEDGLIVTDNGVYRRHKDAIVIYTTNRYASNVPFNPSVRDRCRVFKVETPTAEVLTTRLLERSWLKDRTQVRRMVDIVLSLADTVRDCELDGQIGTRGLIDWCNDVAMGIPFEEAMLHDIIHRITTDEEELELLMPVLAAHGVELQ